MNIKQGFVAAYGKFIVLCLFCVFMFIASIAIVIDETRKKKQAGQHNQVETGRLVEECIAGYTFVRNDYAFAQKWGADGFPLRCSGDQ